VPGAAQGKPKASDLYGVSPSEQTSKAVSEALKSFAIIPFYAVLIIMIISVKMILVAPAASIMIEQKRLPSAVIQQQR